MKYTYMNDNIIDTICYHAEPNVIGRHEQVDKLLYEKSRIPERIFWTALASREATPSIRNLSPFVSIEHLRQYAWLALTRFNYIAFLAMLEFCCFLPDDQDPQKMLVCMIKKAKDPSGLQEIMQQAFIILGIEHLPATLGQSLLRACVHNKRGLRAELLSIVLSFGYIKTVPLEIVQKAVDCKDVAALKFLSGYEIGIGMGNYYPRTINLNVESQEPALLTILIESPNLHKVLCRSNIIDLAADMRFASSSFSQLKVPCEELVMELIHRENYAAATRVCSENAQVKFVMESWHYHHWAKGLVGCPQELWDVYLPLREKRVVELSKFYQPRTKKQIGWNEDPASVIDNQIRFVKALREHGFQIDSLPDLAAAWTAQVGDAKQFSELADMVMLSTPDGTQSPFLQLAISWGHEAIIKILIQKGALINRACVGVILDTFTAVPDYLEHMYVANGDYPINRPAGFF